MHYAATPFSADRPIPVDHYANELNRYVQGIVPNATKDQIKTIEAIATNVKSSHAHFQQKLSCQNNEFEQKLKLKDSKNDALRAKLNRLEKKFEHMEIEKNIYEYNLVCNDQYEDYISNLKDEFKQLSCKTEKVEVERDDYKRSCSISSEKIKMLESQVARLEKTVKFLEKDPNHYESASLNTPDNVKEFDGRLSNCNNRPEVPLGRNTERFSQNTNWRDCREGNTDFDGFEKKDLENGNPEIQKLRADNTNLHRINRCAEKKIDMLNETIEAMKKKISRSY
ncbi:hypothetical protein CRE_18773 [Caenorhabditis remanei]|uniref:Uncharacterized protein n=1 Tax=Caenorhabditis remanei TaxID=31234 RepID=E3LK48_CAERE|nr:hypothetical protein CRE_18773 [Caenorhabditis remanei]